MYEFVYSAAIHKDKRPSFVKADHADDVGFMFGGCFWDGDIKIIGRFYKIFNDLLVFSYNMLV